MLSMPEHMLSATNIFQYETCHPCYGSATKVGPKATCCCRIGGRIAKVSLSLLHENQVLNLSRWHIPSRSPQIREFEVFFVVLFAIDRDSRLLMVVVAGLDIYAPTAKAGPAIPTKPHGAEASTHE